MPSKFIAPALHYTVMDKQFDRTVVLKESALFAESAMTMDMQYVRPHEARDAVQHLCDNFAGRALSFNALYAKSGLDDTCLRLALALMIKHGLAHGEDPYTNREYHAEYYLIEPVVH